MWVSEYGPAGKGRGPAGKKEGEGRNAGGYCRGFLLRVRAQMQEMHCSVLGRIFMGCFGAMQT